MINPEICRKNSPMNRVRVLLLTSALILFSCQEKEPCYCGPLDVPHYHLPNEMSEFFPFPGKEIKYTFRDSVLGTTESLTLKFSEIVGTGIECGWDCISTLKYKCDCKLISFQSDSIIPRTLLRIDPHEDKTTIDFHGFSGGYADYYSKNEQTGNIKVLFKDSVEVSGKKYRDVMLITENTSVTWPIEYWFSKNTGFLKIKGRGSFNLELIEFEILE